MQNPFAAYGNAMESTIVIKVKYGETLRRFNARVNEAGQLDLDIGKLREKVLDLFNFAADADLTLTYIDEDGDVVTLVDAEDLCDVMRQSLNPLRITVKVNAEKGGRFHARSSGNSTPTISRRVQHPLPNLKSSVSELLASFPAPVQETLSKLPLNLASKSASSSPLIADLVYLFSKMGKSYVNPLPEFQAGSESSSQNGALGSSPPAGGQQTAGASMTKETEASRDDGATLEVLPNAILEEPTPQTNHQGCHVNGARDLDATVIPACSLNLNADLLGHSVTSGSESENLAPVAAQDGVGDSKEEVGKFSEADNSAWVNIKAVKSIVLGTGASPSSSATGHSIVDPVTVLGGNTGTRSPTRELVNEYPFTGPPLLLSPMPYTYCGSRVHPFKRSNTHNDGTGLTVHRGVQCDGCGVYPITGPRFKSKVKEDYDVCSNCFSVMGNADDYVRMDRHLGSRMHTFKRSYTHRDGMGSLVHRGVLCDRCRACPITGPRFKSKVKENYDLCRICFSEIGNEADYIRMDHPISSRHLYSFREQNNPMQQPGVCPPTAPQVVPKLDSRFILDVNVLDGTLMAPSTPFCKIWRMRNNGTTVWPWGTQLLWSGGDKLSAEMSVKLEIPVDGLPAENELDVAVDFIAPENPGRYISYWRMATSSGQKFGQRVWVLIQVDASLKDSLCVGIQGLNLNLPPVDNGTTAPECMNGNVEPMVVECSIPQPHNSDTATGLVEPLVDNAIAQKVQDLNFPTNDTLLVGDGVSNTVPSEVAPKSVSFPITQIASALPSQASTDVPEPVQGTSENIDVEETLLRELEEMGFKEVDLNKEILRLNEYDLEQSLDDLCGVAEWDPILEELQEMGFVDKEINKMLLKKNNGSVKRVVMDLITGEMA